MNTIALTDEILNTDSIGAACSELRVMAVRLATQSIKAYAQYGNKDGFTWDWTVARTIDLAKFYRRATLGIVDQWAGQVPADYTEYFWELVAKADRAAITALKSVYA